MTRASEGFERILLKFLGDPRPVLVANPQLRRFGIARPTHSTKWESVHVVGQAIKLSRTPSDIVRLPPTIGEHTEMILAKLDYSQAEIDGIKAAGAV